MAPLAIEDGGDSVEDTVKKMLTENTGRHFLDSGSAYGRHHEENAKNPPWEDPCIQVSSDYIVKNVYHHMTEALDRDSDCVEMEERFYEWAEDRDTSWLADMGEWAKKGDGETVGSFNTYNSEFGSLTQCIQFVGFEDYHGDSYVIVSVHGGCDIRGGYTKPRIFKGHWMELMTHEFNFWCPDCDLEEFESTIDYDRLVDMMDAEKNAVICDECGSEMHVC